MSRIIHIIFSISHTLIYTLLHPSLLCLHPRVTSTGDVFGPFPQLSRHDVGPVWMHRINETRYTVAQTRYFNILGRTEKTVILIILSLMFRFNPCRAKWPYCVLCRCAISGAAVSHLRRTGMQPMQEHDSDDGSDGCITSGYQPIEFHRPV